MAILSYNGVVIGPNDVQTITFSQKPQLTDDKTQYLFDEVEIRIKFWLNFYLTPSQGMDPVDGFNNIKACLTSKGHDLMYQDSDTADIWSVTAPDAKGGPFPGELKVNRIGGATWECEYSITTYVSQCCNDNKTPALLAHRWVDKATIDQNHYTTWSRNGQLYFRYDALNASVFGSQPDVVYRNIILLTCPLKPGFYRTRMEFSPSSDFLKLNYTIEDKEIYAMPKVLLSGGAITDWNATYKISSQKGGFKWIDLNIELTGNKYALKSEMYQVLSSMVADIIGLTPNKARLITNVQYGHSLHENKVNFSGRFQGSGNVNRLDGFNVPAEGGVGRTGTYTGQDSQIPDPGSRGTARLGLLCNIIAGQDPCASGFDVNGASLPKVANPQVPPILSIKDIK